MPLVLVVDDSPIDRKLAVGILEQQADLTVEAAAHGAAALARAAHRPPDVVVTDLQMPEMSGLELVRTMRSRYPLVPVVLMTAHGSEEIAVQALEQGAASYVAKAKLAADLADTVHNVLATARADRRHERLLDCLRQTSLEFVLGNDVALIFPLVDYLQQQIARLGLFDDMGRVRVGIALQEGLNNALFHGNLGLTAEQLNSEQCVARALVERRRRETPYCERQIHVQAKLAADAASFTIRDEGSGFAHQALSSRLLSEHTRAAGRGLVLIRTFMDDVSYNDAGNELTMTKRRD
jgi:CheY-like chemotaxis protein